MKELTSEQKALVLRKRTKKCPNCKGELLFMSWNGMITLINDNGNYDAKCSVCKATYEVKPD